MYENSLFLNVNVINFLLLFFFFSCKIVDSAHSAIRDTGHNAFPVIDNSNGTLRLIARQRVAALNKLRSSGQTGLLQILY